MLNNCTHSVENNLIHVLIDLFTAGSDTLNSTLNFSILYLAKHPEILERVQEEIDQVIGKSRLPDVEDRKRYYCIDLTLSETDYLFLLS